MENFYEALESGECPQDFSEYCRQRGIPPVVLDETLVKETGFSGQEIIDSWQNGICIGKKIY